MAFNKLFRPFLLASGLAVACAAYAADPPAQPAQPAQPAADSSTPVATPAPATSTPPATTPAATPAVTAKENPANKPAAQPSPEAQAEAQAASHLEKKFQEAARSYRQVQKNGQTMYCKKEKPINSTIPRMQCMSESELRLQVEQMDQLRDRMRNSGRCTAGTGCRSGG